MSLNTNNTWSDLNNLVWSYSANKELADLSDESSWLQKVYPFLNIGLNVGLETLLNRVSKPESPKTNPWEILKVESNVNTIRENQLLKNNIVKKPNDFTLSPKYNPKLLLDNVQQSMSSIDDAIVNLKLDFNRFNTPGGLQPNLQIKSLNSPPVTSQLPNLQSLYTETPSSTNLLLNNPLNSTVKTETTTQTTGNSSTLNAAKGAGASMLASYGVNALGGALGTTKTQTGLFVTGVVAQGAGSAAGAVATGQSLSTLGSTANLAGAGLGVANLALDVFDPVKKHWSENVVGLGGAVASLAIPGAGPFIAAGLLAANAFGHITGKKTQEYARDTETESKMGSSYGGFLADSAKALSLQGTKYSGFNDRARKKDDAFITNVKNMRTNLQGIKERSDDRFTIKESMSAINTNRRIYNMLNKYNLVGVYAGKHGMILRAKQISKLQNETSKKEIYESIIIPIEDEIKEFKNGGVIEEVIMESIIIPEYYNESIIIPIEDEILKFQEGGSFNVIPEGALHARLHHMENDENITKKGIPVVSEDENGNLELHAEIENSEIIFRLEVTKKLEELAKENTDESAIEAGKLLVEEILNNTIDHTNKLL